MRIAALDARAAERNLLVGQALSDARALVPELEVLEIDQAYLTQVFADFADWHSNASPIVAVLDDMAPYGDLMLDITGVAHLFGGEAPMLGLLVERLAGLGFSVTGAIADSIGAAWALAHFSPGRIAPPGEGQAVLANLPVSALRLSEQQVGTLSQLGLKTVGQLYGRDRRSLLARFGEVLLRRLDQALGRLAERVVPRIPMAEYFAERRFAEPIGLMDDVLACCRDLAVRLALELEAGQLGAQSFHLMLYRVDHKMMVLSVNASRAIRDADHIASLFANRAERLSGEYDAGFGIDMIRLAASSVSSVASQQSGVFEADDGTTDLGLFYDRLTSRLGPMALVTSQLVDTHIPERAVRLAPVIAEDRKDIPPLPEMRRPIRLMAAPEPIEVLAEVPDGPPIRMVWRRVAYKLLRASGPERIEAEWWRSGQNLIELLPPPHREKQADPRDDDKQHKARPKAPEHVSKLAPYDPIAVTRDYYVVEDDGGRRFWVFRIGLYGHATVPRWYLHGIFA